MAELVIRGGTVVDGTGAAPRRADVAIDDGRIVEVGEVSVKGRREIAAEGLLVTPGFVDLHTHFDGQATWDPVLAPSSVHGVTTVAMGNCGVGFAPARADRHDWLIGLLEGVEDIPGTALAEGHTWGWEPFPEYLAPLPAMRLAPGGELEYPLVQLHPAFAKRMLLALVGAGDEAVERYRDLELEPGH